MAGTIANNLVINLRIKGFILIRRYPSITICPLKVPVMVELCPDAISAMANNVEAIDEPNTGESKSEPGWPTQPHHEQRQDHKPDPSVTMICCH